MRTLIYFDFKILSFFHFLFSVEQEWDQKAVEAKERYTKLIKEFEANGGSKDSGAGKKRGKVVKKAPAKKSKKKADSEDEDSGEEESD